MSVFLREKTQKLSSLIKKTTISILAGILGFVPLGTLVPQIAHAAADTCTWDGSSSANWSDGANWTGCDNSGVPQDGDSLLFPTTASNKTNTNDIVGLDLNRIDIQGDNYVLGGNDLSFTPSLAMALSITGDFNNFGLNSTINGSSSKAIESSGVDNEISGNMVLNLTGGGDMNFTTGSDTNDLEISGVISGSTDIFVVSPDSRLFLTGTNTFNKSGITINDTSILDCGVDSCLGTYSSGDTVTIWGGGRLYLDNNISLSEDIDFQASDNSPGQIWAAASSTITGNIQTVTSASAVIGVQNTTILTIDGDIDTDTGGSIQFQGVEGYADNEIDVNGVFTGAGDVYIVDSLAILAGASTGYTGTYNVQSGGLLYPTDSDALGDDTGETIIADGGTLYTDTMLDIPEPLIITGDGLQSDGYNGAIVGDTSTHVFSGPVTLDGDATIMNWDSGMTLSMRGTITGTGNLTLAGLNVDNAPIELGGSGTSEDDTPNSFVGHTYVNGARLFMHKNDGVSSVPGDITVTSGTYAASLWTQSEEQIPNDATVTLNEGLSTAVLVVTGGRTETVGTVEGDGVIQLGSTSDVLNVGGGDKSGIFTGRVLAGTGTTLHKIGNGTWDFQGSNWDLGGGVATYDVIDGKLLVNAADTSLGDSSITLTGGTLGGENVVGPITAYAGGIAPGNSPGCLNPEGDVAMTSSVAFSAELAGTTVCTGYDKMFATGNVILNGATLNATLSFASTTGNSFTIIEASSVSGTFAGLDDNETFVLGSRTFKIDYTPTTVVLSDVGEAPTTSSGSLGQTGVVALTGISTAILLTSAAGLYLVNRRKYLVYRQR